MLPPPPQILCVEDNEDISAFLEEALSAAGYQVTVASTVARALAAAQSISVNLYLLDNQLPDGTGLELCRAIRGFDQDTPILFFSAVSDNEVRQTAFNAGAQGYLQKPVGLDALVQTVAKLLRSGKELPQGDQ
jgi:DNA-binding response OmpR family regulator